MNEIEIRRLFDQAIKIQNVVLVTLKSGQSEEGKAMSCSMGGSDGFLFCIQTKTQGEKTIKVRDVISISLI